MSDVEGLFFWMMVTGLMGTSWIGALYVRLSVTADIIRLRQ